MKPYCFAFRRQSNWLSALTMALCLVPAATASFLDGVCAIGTTGPCPGTILSGVPTGPIFVPEGFGQTPLPVGVTAVPGDVLVLDDMGGTILGDVLRFPDIGTGVALFVLLLSDPGDPADTGLPGSFQPNTFSMFEGGPPILYTATPGGQVYTIGSDFEVIPDVPEPGTFSLLVVAALGWAIRMRIYPCP